MLLSERPCFLPGSHEGAVCLGDVQAGGLVLKELVLWVISASLCASKGNLFQVSGGPRRRRQSAPFWARVASSLRREWREPSERPFT